LNKLLRSAGQSRLLGESPEVYKLFNKLLLCRLLLKIDKDCRRMSVQDRNTHALAGDLRQFCLHDLTILYSAQYTERLLFALFFSSDKRNDVALHLRPVFKSLSGS